MKKKMYEIIFVILLLVGVIVCTVCDILITGSYTWSLVPISAVVFAWVALLPVTRYGKKGIWASILILNACIFTYLYIIGNVAKENELIYSIGWKMARNSILYLIGIFALFKIFKKRKFRAIGLSLMLGIPVCININFNLAHIYRQAAIDIWDMLSIFTLLTLSVAFLIFDINANKKKKMEK